MVGLSSPEIRNKVVPYILEQKPKTVFDLGMGSGLYGAMIRSVNPDIVMIGLDGWLPYFQTQFSQQYTARIHAPIEAVINGVFPVWGDIVLCMDVIEHFEKKDAVKLLVCLKDAPMLAIVSTPLFEYKQGPVEGNDFEAHKCWFTEEELGELGWKTLFKEWHEALDGQKGYMGAFIDGKTNDGN